jgi:hypothetical protein
MNIVDSQVPEHLPWLRGEDLEWVMGRGVGEWLGWPLPKERPE